MSDTANFLGYPSVPLEDALFSVIPAPYQATSTYVKGQDLAPRHILDASSQIEDYDEETDLNLVDEGIHCIEPEDAPEEAEMQRWVKEQVGAALDNTAVPVIIGGEGTVTFWGVQALLPRCDELSILHIDARSDLNEFEAGEEDHHTVMREILQLTPTPHICQVGVRSVTKDGFDLIFDDKVPIECIFMSDIHRSGDEAWHDDVIEELRTPVYLSIDLTGFDPSVIPAVGNPEPGGLGWWQVLRLIKKVAARRRIAAIDVTELCPQEGQVVSDFAAARLIYKTMNYIRFGDKMLPKPASEEAEEEEE